MRLHWILALVVVVAGCRSAPREVVIFYTNDIHGRFVAEPAAWRKDQALVGGMTALAFHLDSLRGIHSHSLYLDAGDLMTGNPVCNLVYDGVAGGALLELLRRCGVSAACLGNHEFDLGADHLRDFVAAAPFPVVCANLRERSTGRCFTEPAHVFVQNGVRVGVIGVLLDRVSGVVSRKAIEPFLVDSASAAVQREINRLDPQTDLIVILSHCGFDEDSLMATRLRYADVIVGGHSHTRLEKPRRVNGVVIVQAGAYLKNLGLLRLQVAGDSVVGYEGSLVELVLPKHPPRSDAAQLADSLEVAIQAQYGQVIGELATAWRAGYDTGSNAGNWICDRLRQRYRADIALVNAGGIRGGVDPGPVTKLDVLQLLPFSNSVVLFSVTAAELRKVAEEQARAQGLGEHGALEMSGMTVKYRHIGDAVRVTQLLVDGKPLDEARTFRVVSIDYVAQSQWNRYLGFEPRDVETTGELLSDVVISEIAAAIGPITADTTVRLREIP